MSKIFFDTNIVLDSVLKRDNFLPASILISLCDSKKEEGCLSILSMANIAYIARKGRTKEELRILLAEIATIFNVLAMDNEQLQKALNVDAPDIEDVLQYECAKANQCNIIITNNTKHFPFADVAVMTAQEYLNVAYPQFRQH